MVGPFYETRLVRAWTVPRRSWWQRQPRWYAIVVGASGTRRETGPHPTVQAAELAGRRLARFLR